MQIAETEHLIFREFDVSDAECLHRIYSVAETMKFLGEYTGSAAEVRIQIQKHIEDYYERHGFGLWAAILKKNNRLIGRCGLLYQEIDGAKDLEVAYLFDRNYWGNGLATEAAAELIKLGSEKFGYRRIIAVINPENAASIRVAEKVGLKYEREIEKFKDFGKVRLYALESS